MRLLNLTVVEENDKKNIILLIKVEIAVVLLLVSNTRWLRWAYNFLRKATMGRA
jgi:hypothetical protein